LTFAPMVDSETSRFALRHYGVDYRERPHVFAWGSLVAFVHSGNLRVPLLYGGGLRLTSPRVIVDHYDTTRAAEARLVPATEPAHSAVQADWDLYNGQLALYTAVLAYFYLLPRKDLLMEPFFRGVPDWEKRVFRHTYGFQRLLFTLLLRLTQTHADEALRQIRQIFDRTDQRVADGRPYLVGNTVTLSDIALAAAAAPLLLPAGYRAPIPPFETMPQDLQEIITELRGHPTAKFVAGIYARHAP
jgi:glutathione S-transferase